MGTDPTQAQITGNRADGHVDEQHGDDAVIRQRIEDHLPLVRHIVFQVAANFPRHVDREELARAGALGLVEAARRYDDDRGVPFARFVAQRIRGSILDAVRASDWAPRSVRTLARNLDVAEQALASRLGRVPTLHEVADELGVEIDELHRLQDRVHRSVVLALDYVVAESDDEDLTLGDMVTDVDALGPCEELESRELDGYVRDAVRLLPERHRLVITGYFLEDQTSADLARFLGVTESRVSQLRSEALTMLREGIEAQYRAGAGRCGDESPRVARRKQRYATSIACASDWQDRISA